MLTASELRPGLAVRVDRTLYRIVEATYHGGQGKMGGVLHAKLRNLETGTMREWRFRADEAVEEITPERQNLQFLYGDDRHCYFMHPDTFEQTAVDQARIGRASRFLTEEMVLPVEFVEGQPIGVIFPEIVEARIAETAAPVHAQGGTSVWKDATLENGLTLLVPQFIAAGETIRVDVQRCTYVERAKKK